MKRAALDALCGEYLIGTLRGAARRRFERALHDEPLVAQRLRHWQNNFTPRYAQMIEARPSPRVWKRLEKTLGLARAPWYRRAGWAIAVTAALVIAVGVRLAMQESEGVLIAQLSGQAATVSAHLSRDRRTLVLHADRPVIAGPAQSYELWLLTPEGGVLSLAVLGSLDTRFELPERHRGTLRGQLAVSVEPAGGSQTGKPTGPVILIGPIKT
ncbi:MAG TPA: anti-sigma factor [Burkholderiales bacterium]|nr:anti-sigma factor [Burkholderiales bacterium]